MFCCFGKKVIDSSSNDVKEKEVVISFSLTCDFDNSKLRDQCIEYVYNNPGLNENKFIYTDLTLINKDPLFLILFVSKYK